jgi:hypothetical protein
MPWFKVDDTLAFHHKTIAAGNAAMGMWVRAGSWSRMSGTDGFIPGDIARSLGTTAQAKRLVSAGLWDEMPTGYAFHQWDERQPSKAEMEQERADNARRQQEWRDRKKAEKKGKRNAS